ncbi:MAG: hypothetical protein AMXMBFR33_56100 [Candidatus Xenobia bacterium]
MREEKAHAGEAFAWRQAELRAELERYRCQLEDERHRREEKWQQFQKELRPALQQIGDAFQKLLH